MIFHVVYVSWCHAPILHGIAAISPADTRPDFPDHGSKTPHKTTGKRIPQ